MNGSGSWVVLGTSLMLLGVAGCGDDDCCSTTIDASPADVSMNPALTEVALFPTTTNRALDLLFIIDDSPSMADKQANLRASFPALVNVLATAPGGLPDLHIGVISTDVGTKGVDSPTAGPGIGSGPGSCSGSGKAGVLQTNGAPLTGNFISDIRNGDGSRMVNYSGTLADAFSAMAAAGSSGCGFEQPLHALQLALTNTTDNAGFLRPTARLGILLLSDEDDCSASQPTLFGTDTTTLGQLQSFRCTRFGVRCDIGGTTPDEMNQVGTKSGCESNESSAYLKPVAHYSQFLTGLKADRRDILFGAIVGPESPFGVELRTPPGGGTAMPAIAHSCMYMGSTGPEVADPAARLVDFANNLPHREIASVCNGSLSTVMTQMGQRMKSLVGDSCLERAIAQPATCEGFDVDGQGTATPLPECTATSGLPCFSIVTDAVACPALQNLKVDVMRATPASADTWTSVRCAL